MIDPSGVYELGGLPMEILPDGPTWKLVIAGVPTGFEPALRRIDETSFQLERGPFAGAVITFDSDGGGSAGPIPIERIEGPYREPPGYGLEPPPFQPDHLRDDAFRDLLAATPSGARIDWDLSHPKHEFVRWAQKLDRFIFHSSTNPDIEEFQPVRDSIELADHGGRGNLDAVYGAHDGYWSMFFGIVDRTILRGSMRNGVQTWTALDGRTTTMYQFSLEKESLVKRPFTTGAIYLLPRETFRRLPYYPGGPLSEEWASEQPVRPVASLQIEPTDFPLLDRIAGHDESEFLEMMDRFGEVVATATALEDGTEITIHLSWSNDVAESFRQWSALADRFIPSVSHRLEGKGDARRLVLDGPKPYLDGVARHVGQILAERSVVETEHP